MDAGKFSNTGHLARCGYFHCDEKRSGDSERRRELPHGEVFEGKSAGGFRHSIGRITGKKSLAERGGEVGKGEKRVEGALRNPGRLLI